MANLKKFITFIVQWVGDGTNSQVVVKFLSDPISFILPATASEVAPLFDITKSLPSSVSSVTVGGATISGTPAYNSITGQLTINFTAAPSAGALGNIQGNLEYS